MISQTFIERNMTRDRYGETSPLKLNVLQRYALRSINKHTETIMLHSRQVGVDKLLSCICAYYMTVQHENVEIEYVDRSWDSVGRFIEKCIRKIDKFPKALQVDYVTKSPNIIRLTNGCTIYGDVVAPNRQHAEKVLCSKQPNIVIVNNAGWIAHMAEAWPVMMGIAARAYQQKDPLYKMIIASSGGSGDTWFQNTWNDTMMGQTGFTPLYMHYDYLNEDEYMNADTIKNLTASHSTRMKKEFELI